MTSSSELPALAEADALAEPSPGGGLQGSVMSLVVSTPLAVGDPGAR
jgi:hypothetical protein